MVIKSRGDISIAGEELGNVTLVNWYVAEQYRLRIFLYDGTEVTDFADDATETTTGVRCNVAGYTLAMWLLLLFVLRKRVYK